MIGNFFTWGIPLGSIARIRIKISWILIVFWFGDLASSMPKSGVQSPEGRLVLLAWLLGTVLVFGTIFFHELGHCFAARRVGGDAEEILLWPLGGLAYVSAPNHWRAQFIVAAGGPLVNVVIAAIAWPVFLMLDGNPALAGSRWYLHARWALCYWNLFLLIFNLVPLYPLDGGRIFHALAWRHQENKGGYGMGPYFRATMATVWASRVTAIAVALYALFAGGGIFMIIIAAWAWFGAEQLRMRVLSGEGEETTFGYDFSKGYTSVERGWSAAEKGEAPRPGFFARLAAKRRAKRRAKRETMSEGDEARLEELLAWIHRDGFESLSRRDKKFLDTMSRKRRAL